MRMASPGLDRPPSNRKRNGSLPRLPELLNRQSNKPGKIIQTPLCSAALLCLLCASAVRVGLEQQPTTCACMRQPSSPVPCDPSPTSRLLPLRSMPLTNTMEKSSGREPATCDRSPCFQRIPTLMLMDSSRESGCEKVVLIHHGPAVRAPRKEGSATRRKCQGEKRHGKGRQAGGVNGGGRSGWLGTLGKP